MSERIRGSYDDALYKSTFTLLTLLLYFVVDICTQPLGSTFFDISAERVKIKHNRSLGSHYQTHFKFILRNMQRSMFFAIVFRLPAIRSPHTLNRRSAYTCDAGAEIRSMAILYRSGYPASRAYTAIQNCTRAHFCSIGGKFSLWTTTSRCWLGTRTGQLLRRNLNCFKGMRVSGAQSLQCHLQGTVVSVIIIFVLDFFVFVLVFVNENHTGPHKRLSEVDINMWEHSQLRRQPLTLHNSCYGNSRCSLPCLSWCREMCAWRVFGTGANNSSQTNDSLRPKQDTQYAVTYNANYHW